MAEAFLICFFVGLFFTVASFVLSAVIGGHAHDGDTGVADADVGDVDVGHVDVGDLDVGGVDVSHDFDMGHDFDHAVAEAGGDGHVEVGVGDSFPGLSPWSPTVLSAFVTTFGGVGFLALDSFEVGIPGSLLAGIVAAAAIAGSVFWGMNRIFAALQSSSEVHVADLKGRTAEVLTPIPEGGVGEIVYEVSGTRQTAPARTVTGKPVGRGERVKIVRIGRTTFLVKRA